jgi:hypothetical protein
LSDWLCGCSDHFRLRLFDACAFSMGQGEYAANGGHSHDRGYCHGLAAILPKIHLPTRHEEAILLSGFRGFDSPNNRSWCLLGWQWLLLFNECGHLFLPVAQ